MKKNILIISGIVIIIFFIFLILYIKNSANVKTKNSTENAAEDTTNDMVIKFRITWDDYSGRGESIQKIVDSYNEKYSEGCSINVVSGDEDRATIQNLLKSDSETICVLPYRYVKYFGDQGDLMNLTADFQEEENLFYPEVWELGTVDEKTYGVPWLGHSMGLIYNKNLLEEAGVDPKSIHSLDALLAAILAVEGKTDAKGIGLVGAEGNDVSWMVNQFIYGFGSSLVSEDGKSVTINNEKSKAAIEFYKDVLGKHAQSSWLNDSGNEVMDCFRKQEVAFEIQGIWGVTDILKNGASFETGIIAMKDVGLCAEVGPMMLAVPANMNQKMKEEALKFIRYMISMEAQEKIMNGEYSPEYDAYYPFRTPIRIDMADSQIMQSYPEYLTFIEEFQNPSVDVPVPKWEMIKDEFYGAGLHKVMNGQMTIDDFLVLIETEGNKILNAQ